MKKLFVIFCVLQSVFAQEVDPEEILENVKLKFSKVEDYIVDATIKVDVNFLRVPETKAVVYFKHPDKFKLDSEGFALLPRQGLNFSPSSLLSGDFSSLYSREDKIDDRNVHVIKVIPNTDTTNVILSTLWIDTRQYVVRKIETTTKNSGTITIEMDYAKESDFGLPSEVKLSFKVSEMNIPHAMTGDFDTTEETEDDKGGGPMTGIVIVNYENYQINQGLTDDFFEDEAPLE